MEMNSTKRMWAGRGLTWLIVLAISCSTIFLSSFMLGPALFSGDALGRKVAVNFYCPGAVSVAQQDGSSVQTASSPSGTYGHTVEITCTMPGGSTRTIRNEQYAAASIASMFGGGALCGLVLSLPLFSVPFFLFRKKKTV